MGRRGNQTFLKNQKAQKRVARANAKRAEKQARRDEKVARANTGDVTSGPPIDWNEAGEQVEAGGLRPDDGDTEVRGDGGEGAESDDAETPDEEPAHSTER